MSETQNLNLPLVAPAQAQKHVTVNEALSRIDALVHLSVESRNLPVPPATVEEGQSFLVADGASGVWAGQDGVVANYFNGGWQFLPPSKGWTCWVANEAVTLHHDGDKWLANALAQSTNGAALRAEVVESDIVLTGGVEVETAAIIPAGVCVLAVTGRVVSAITGSLTHWQLGVADATDRYGDMLGLAEGAFLRGVTGQPVAYYSDTTLRIGAVGGEFEAGVVRLAVHMLRFDLPRLG